MSCCQIRGMTMTSMSSILSFAVASMWIWMTCQNYIPKFCVCLLSSTSSLLKVFLGSSIILQQTKKLQQQQKQRDTNWLKQMGTVFWNGAVAPLWSYSHCLLLLWINGERRKIITLSSCKKYWLACARGRKYAENLVFGLRTNPSHAIAKKTCVYYMQKSPDLYDRTHFN